MMILYLLILEALVVALFLLLVGQTWRMILVLMTWIFPMTVVNPLVQRVKAVLKSPVLEPLVKFMSGLVLVAMWRIHVPLQKLLLKQMSSLAHQLVMEMWPLDLQQSKIR